MATARGARRVGKAHPHKGHKQSAAARRKIGAAQRGKRHPHKGHRMSAAARARISAGVRAAARRRKKAGRPKVKRKATAKQLAALAAARHKQKGRKRSAKQLAALAKARAKARTMPRSAKQLAAARKSGARLAAMSRTKPRTPKQLAALTAGRQRAAQLRYIDKLVAHNRALTDAQKAVLARRATGKLAGTAHVKPPAVRDAAYVAGADFASYRAQLASQVAARGGR